MKKYTMEMLNNLMRCYGGTLDLRGCTGLTRLPDNLTVGDWIYRDGRKFRRTK